MCLALDSPGSYPYTCLYTRNLKPPGVRYFEGSKIYPIAVVVSEYSFVASHYSAVKSLSQWLEERPGRMCQKLLLPGPVPPRPFLSQKWFNYRKIMEHLQETYIV